MKLNLINNTVMKLYVWSNPYRVSYGSTLVFAVAENLERAKEIASTGKAYTYNEYGQKTPQVNLGDPIRVLDLPCAEWHEWSE